MDHNWPEVSAYNTGFNATCFDRNIAAKNPYNTEALANEWSRGYLDGIHDYDQCEEMFDDE